MVARGISRTISVLHALITPLFVLTTVSRPITPRGDIAHNYLSRCSLPTTHQTLTRPQPSKHYDYLASYFILFIYAYRLCLYVQSNNHHQDRLLDGFVQRLARYKLSKINAQRVTSKRDAFSLSNASRTREALALPWMPDPIARVPSLRYAIIRPPSLLLDISRTCG